MTASANRKLSDNRLFFEIANSKKTMSEGKIMTHSPIKHSPLQRHRNTAWRSVAVCAVAAVAYLTPESVLAFAGIPDSGGCTDFINNPQDFARHRLNDITYRISNNFKARYPDDFSQYLVRDVVELWEIYIGGVTP
jgi:hypothetical protein